MIAPGMAGSHNMSFGYDTERLDSDASSFVVQAVRSLSYSTKALSPSMLISMSHKTIKILLFFAALLIADAGAIAQGTEPVLTLADIFKNDVYKQKGFGPVRWMKDDGYSTLEENRSLGGSEIVHYDARTGARSVVVPADRLIPEGESRPLTISGYEWSADNSKLLIFTNTRKVWRYHTRGDYWVLELSSGSLYRLGRSVPPATLMFAKFSPDGTKVGYVSQLNIYVEDLNTRKITQLTADGGSNIINGTFDWVYEEELDCRDGFRWSPDGEHIAFWQSDTKGVGTFYLINNVD